MKRSMTTHEILALVSKSFIENLNDFGVVCAPAQFGSWDIIVGRRMVMAKMTTSLFHGTSISIDDAIARRDEARKCGVAAPHFECDECSDRYTFYDDLGTSLVRKSDAARDRLLIAAYKAANMNVYEAAKRYEQRWIDFISDLMDVRYT